MAKPGRGARMKGANFERKIAKLLTEHTGIEWQRGLGQARKGGSEIADVYSEEVPGVHFEAKRHIRCNIKAAMRQALGDVSESGKLPIVVTKDDRAEILVTMRFEDWITMFDLYLKQE